MKEIYSEAQSFFVELLYSEQGKAARDLLLHKNIAHDQAVELGLGFSLPLTGGLLQRLTGGYDIRDILESRLVVQNSDGKGYYDRFRNRVMFPVKDETGQVVGFIGRAVGSGQPRYMTTPQTNKALMDEAISKAEKIFGD